MSDQDQEFQQRWGFRRNESDLDSSSEDHSAKPTSSGDPPHLKNKNNQETINIDSDPDAEHEPEQFPPVSEEQNPPSKGKNRRPREKVRGRNVTPKKKEKTENSCDLSGYSETLIEGVRYARVDLLKWMSKEMGMPVRDDDDEAVPSKKAANPRRRGQKQNPAKRAKSGPPNKGQGRRKPAQKQQQQQQQTPMENTTVDRPKEPENAPKSTTTADNNETVAVTEKPKRKRSAGLSVRKQKIVTSVADAVAVVAASDGDKGGSKTAVVALPAPVSAPVSTPNYLTLPTVRQQQQQQPQQQQRQQPERNTDRNPTVDSATEREFAMRNVGLFNFPRAQQQQQKDPIFAQSGLRNNVGDFEQNVGLTLGNVRGNGSGPGFPFSLQNNGNGNGNSGLANASGPGFPFSLQNSGNENGNGNESSGANGSGPVFPFPLHNSGNASGSGPGFPFSLYSHLNGGMGMGIQNPGQFGMQFLAQDNRVSGGGHRMNGGVSRMGNGGGSSLGFVENYGALNQHLRFKPQGGSLGLQCPEIRGPNLPPK